MRGLMWKHFVWSWNTSNRVAGGISPPAPPPHGMRVRTGPITVDHNDLSQCTSGPSMNTALGQAIIARFRT